MRQLAASVAVALPLLAALACGGRVGVVGGDGGGPSCPTPATVVDGVACSSAGQTCSGSIDPCGTTLSADCTCTGGVWSCPPLTGPGCITSCPPINGVEPGSSCDLATESACTVELTSVGCDGSPVTAECACQSTGAGAATWACVQSSEPECLDAGPPSGCPDPSQVVPGNACNASPQLACDSSTVAYDCSGNALEIACECFEGAWTCPQPPSCPPPTCPAPQDVEQGVSCNTPGEQCPGNPSYCDGAEFFDAFECDDGAWNDVAATSCNGSGSSSGGGGSSGGFVDAGFAADAKGL